MDSLRNRPQLVLLLLFGALVLYALYTNNRSSSSGANGAQFSQASSGSGSGGSAQNAQLMAEIRQLQQQLRELKELARTKSSSDSTALVSSSKKGGCPEAFKLKFPPHIKSLKLQVGAHASPMAAGPDEAVISFEPQINLVTRNNAAVGPNVYMVPAAATNHGGLAMFDLTSGHDAAASLNSLANDYANWKGKLTIVPTVTIASIMECIPFERVPFFMCDAQGSDIDVMKSAGEHLRRFDKIEVEVQVNGHHYYSNDNSKESMIEYMESMGFYETYSECNSGLTREEWLRDKTKCLEENVWFEQRK